MQFEAESSIPWSTFTPVFTECKFVHKKIEVTAI